MVVRLLQEYRAQPPRQQQPPPPKIQVTDPQVRDPVGDPTHLSTSPFGQIEAWTSINGATVITWQQNRHFRGTIPADAVLVLEFSLHATNVNSWIRVSEQPVTCYLEDKVNRWRGQSIEGYYRLRIVGTGCEYVSEQTQLFSKLSFTEYRTALKILRAENRQFYTKSAGYILKRRWIGVRCTRCNDFLINNAKEGQCPICYGTGFIGGYFGPVQCGMEISGNGMGSGDVVNPERGAINDGNAQGRIVALYNPEMNDVWVDSTTGSRWRVNSHSIIVHSRSVPIVLQCQLRHIPTSDVVYSFKPGI
jgi:hypothetical protein